MAEFKLSVETDDPEIFLKSLKLAVRTLLRSQQVREAIINDHLDLVFLEKDLIAANEALVNCTEYYSDYNKTLARERHEKAMENTENTLMENK